MEPTDPTAQEVRPAGSARTIAWVDGRIIPAADATIPLLDDGFLRGDAVFEAVLVRGGRTHALDAHLARMRRSAAALDLRLPVLRRTIADLLAAWGERDGVLRLIVTRAGSVRGILGTAVWPDSISLAVVEMPWRSALSGVKTLSYAANQWAVRRARTLGADDAVIVDGEAVMELPTGALLLIHDGVVSTPDPQRLPILDSVTVRELAETVEVVRATPSVADLRSADEIFVVSATRPVLPVHAIVLADSDERELPAPGERTAAVRAAFDEAIDRRLDPLP